MNLVGTKYTPGCFPGGHRWLMAFDFPIPLLLSLTSEGNGLTTYSGRNFLFFQMSSAGDRSKYVTFTVSHIARPSFGC